MKLTITEDTEVVIEGKKILLEKGDTICLEDEVKMTEKDLEEPEPDVLNYLDTTYRWLLNKNEKILAKMIDRIRSSVKSRFFKPEQVPSLKAFLKNH